ncbi:unnamed protein product [Protopolystoma xenopodis]|uniref:Uncharacterized protein n=1 Tax=Protopolystoma xenopodis TaxID=117903 RepID=A0A3S5CP61_9PLAT|nr:unnamed protein product [Protopolystoma xenopodis]
MLKSPSTVPRDGAVCFSLSPASFMCESSSHTLKGLPAAPSAGGQTVRLALLRPIHTIHRIWPKSGFQLNVVLSLHIPSLPGPLSLALAEASEPDLRGRQVWLLLAGPFQNRPQASLTNRPSLRPAGVFAIRLNPDEWPPSRSEGLVIEFGLRVDSVLPGPAKWLYGARVNWRHVEPEYWSLAGSELRGPRLATGWSFRHAILAWFHLFTGPASSHTMPDRDNCQPTLGNGGCAEVNDFSGDRNNLTAGYIQFKLVWLELWNQDFQTLRLTRNLDFGKLTRILDVFTLSRLR